MKMQTHILADQWSDHVTPNNRKAVTAMIQAGATQGKIGRAIVTLMKREENAAIYRITRNETTTIGADPKSVNAYVKVSR